MKEILYQGTCGLILDDLDFSGNRLQTMIISHRTAPKLQLPGFFATLTVPLFFSALETASSKPFVVLGQAGWDQFIKEG